MKNIFHVVALLLSFTALSSCKRLWSKHPAHSTSIIQTAYPIGNGRLGALPFGEPGHEKLNLNHDSLWSGGPFENSSYDGGNPEQPVNVYLPGIRDWIWQNGTGNVTKLMGDGYNYGSFAVLGNLSITISNVDDAKDYERSLDLRTGVHTTSYSSGGQAYKIETYCSYPDEVCVVDITSSGALPTVDIGFENTLSNASLISTSCSETEAHLHGITAAYIGMTYKATARLLEHPARSRCDNGTLSVSIGQRRELSLVIAAGTDYEESHGDLAHDFSFRGSDPGPYVESTVKAASRKSPKHLKHTHISDYCELSDAFALDLPDPHDSSKVETAELIANYKANSSSGNPYLESLMFDFGRHLFISSSRPGGLPPNLQGVWAQYLSNAWGADYHANINLQMNHWGVDQTGLGSLQEPLWDYMDRTWAPRGNETAELLYAAPGWVTHNEMNIFGHTGMKMGDAIWADYPASAAWMMQHVWDHYDYSRDVEWLKAQGYPKLLKPIAQFWASQLQEDRYFEDGTLVVNPCTSPEHGPTTFGCTHFQQLIYQVFVTALQSAAVVDEKDSNFTSSLETLLIPLDKGLHIGSWGQVQEWKLDLDTQNNIHRHLSELVGWYPGWSIASYQGGYGNSTVQQAVATSLWSRGIGIEDANSGWEKVWRSACWARLNETERAYYELRLTIQENWAPNGLSMYDGHSEPFQIDANFGFVGAVLSMLVVDMPMLDYKDSTRTVVLGPAIPSDWANGSVKGLKLRGGGSVDFSWDAHGVVTKATLDCGPNKLKVMNKNGDVLGSSQ
ncbi:glycoside hydrolase family 95 protein [Hortaea werneckii]|nr:glycoside hydrolase family 95 protein [Hortaea werneckii]